MKKRAGKQGLDYFSFDVDFFNDEKVELMAARFGCKGEIIAIKLLCRIYRNGYFIEWNDDIALLFAKSVGDGIQHTLVKDVVFELLKRGFFSQSIFERFGILTSRGIQKRYFDAVEKRKYISVIKEYLLIDINDIIEKISVISLNSDILPLNSDILPLNSDISAQRKRKEKEKESKENNNCQNLDNFDSDCDSSNSPVTLELDFSLEEKKAPSSQEELLFEECRKKYPGTKRGFNVEFGEFKKKHKTIWREAAHLLKPAIEKEIEYKQKLKENGLFVPEWKHFKTWISQSCWEQELPEPDLTKSIIRRKNGTITTNQQYERPDWAC